MDGLSHPTPLAYAPAPRRGSRFWRRVGWVLLLIFIAFIFVRVGPVAWRNTKLLYLERDCFSYSPSPDQLVFAAAPSVSLTAPAWNELSRELWGTPSAEATLFLHERTSPAGHQRLVVVELLRARRVTFEVENWLVPGIRVFAPGSALRPPQERIETRPSIRNAFGPDDRIYAGQIDPADASHFTLRKVNASGETILDGWLRDDDTVLIEPRPTQPFPTTLPAEN